jgi:hypothetical protein
MSHNKRITETSTVKVAIEVSFAVGKSDYGTINVPVGTKVHRFKDVRTLGNGQKSEKWSDWFVQNPSNLSDSGRLQFNGWSNEWFIMDATNYGISIPAANVVEGGQAVKHAKSFHY